MATQVGNSYQEMRGVLAGCLIALALLTLPFPGVAGPLQDPAHSLPPSRLAVQPNAGHEVDPASADMGQINALDAALIQHVFLLKNTTSGILTITQLLGNGFSSLTIEEDLRHRELASSFNLHFMENLHINIAPGQAIHLKTILNPALFVPGHFQRQVQVVLSGQEDPALTLTMNGDVLPAVTMTPTLLDFGRIQVGAPASVILTVKADARLFDPDRMPNLIVRNPFILSTPLPPLAPEATVAASSMPLFITRRYKLAVSPQASLGPLTGSVSFSSTPKTASHVQQYGEPSSIQGEVVGSMILVPETVDFGTIPVGTPSVRRAALTLASATPAGSLKVFCGFDASFTARLLTADGQVVATSGATEAERHNPPPVQAILPAGTKLTLEVTLTPDKPAMGVSRQIFVEIGTRQRLNVPVTAKIVRNN